MASARKKKAEDPRGKMPPPRRPKVDPKKAKKAEVKAARAEAEKAKKAAPKKPRVFHEPRPVEPDLGDIGAERTGYVALVGRPNVGKSTILNQLLGQKIAATTHKPQTTRRNLIGILNPRGAQILLLDTPGHHQAKGPLNRYMVQQVTAALRDADVVAYVVEARPEPEITPGNARLIEEIKQSEKPVVLVVNKVDRVPKKAALLPLLEAYSAALGPQLRGAVPISAMRRSGLDRLVKELALNLPEGPAFYEPGQMTDASERAIAAELIREKLILETKEELPYAAAITIEAFEDGRPKLVRIIATVHVERESQKAIVIGKGGLRLKAIGQRAREEIEQLVGAKVFLDLQVRTTSHWTERPGVMAELGYGES